MLVARVYDSLGGTVGEISCLHLDDDRVPNHLLWRQRTQATADSPEAELELLIGLLRNALRDVRWSALGDHTAL